MADRPFPRPPAVFVPLVSATRKPPTEGPMTKLLWHSNAPWSPTGYGQQTSLFAPLLAEKYDLAISS